MSEIDARDAAQRTALHRACEAGDLEKVKHLLKKKASVNVKDKNNWTPLHCAASSKSLEIVRLLLKAGADPTITTNTETTALHYLSRLPVETKKKDSKDGVLALLKILLEKGARVNAKNSTGMTALHEAAYKGSDATIAFLLKNGATLEEKDKYGETPLHYAMRAAKKENVEALLQAGAKPDVAGKRGTAVDVAEDKSLVSIVKDFSKTKDPNEKRNKDEKEEDDGLGVVLATNAEDLPDKVKKSLTAGAFSNDKVNANFKEVLHILQFITRKRYVNLDANLIKRTDPTKVYPTLQLLTGQQFPSTYYHAKNNNGEKFLIRRLPNEKKKIIYQNIREIAYLSKLDHANLPTFVESYIHGDECWIVMQPIEGSLLKNFFGKVQFTEQDISFIVRQILKVLYYFQQGNLVHRSVNSSNIFIGTNGEVKLLDLNNLTDADMIPTGQMCGPPMWMSPEMIEGKQTVSGATDIWGVGLIVTEMANGGTVQYASDLQAMFKIATQDPPGLSNPNNFSATLRSFLNICLEKNPAKRLIPEELYKHDFITTGPARPAMVERMKDLFTALETDAPTDS
eukprot:TRINITY_DN9011_c0_g1_i1.p1 TRINITY_DN9011_c0_g1~~TRINITY_DN9011_c0_g1_i1.p1  ORF type:complete len:569 (+),score=146.30 TRINITY_DN9011_c0_g1_i1:78-1784(+)